MKMIARLVLKDIGATNQLFPYIPALNAHQALSVPKAR